MTEAEWLKCKMPRKMLEQTSGMSDRKRRLFACACVCHWWVLRFVPNIRIAVEVAERFADGQADAAELAAVRSAELAEVRSTPSRPHSTFEGAFEDIELGIRAAYELLSVPMQDLGEGAILGAGGRWEREWQATLLRDVVGNPFRMSPPIDPSWLGWNNGVIPRLAQAIYDERAFDRLPILADALEDAGCENADILAHCRQPGEHVRGCWVLDLLLGKQ